MSTALRTGTEADASPLQSRIARELERVRAAQLYRVRRVVAGGHGAYLHVDGRDCVNFCSNDYLGLAADPRISAAACAALAAGTGSGAAALVSGYNREHQALEEALAQYLQRERVLLFSTGWAANLGVLRGLLTKSDVLLADELNHASLIDGGRLSGARYIRVPHANIEAYARELGALAAARSAASDPPLTLMAVDGIFSMDGDAAPLAQLTQLSQQHAAVLMVDDAHGFGVLGAGGRGVIEQLGLPPPAIQVGTLGKALGCAGAFVAGDEDLIEFLIQRARSWIFSTAPPPAIAAAARAALALTAGDEGRQRRTDLFANVQRFRSGCAQQGIALSASVTPIQPLVLGGEGGALRLSQYLFERGFWVAAIRPPTVPAGTARLRITLSAAHSPAQIEQLIDLLAQGLRACP